MRDLGQADLRPLIPGLVYHYRSPLRGSIEGGWDRFPTHGALLHPTAQCTPQLREFRSRTRGAALCGVRRCAAMATAKPTRYSWIVNTPTNEVRAQLALEFAKAEPEIDLARAALLVAKEEYPQLPLEQYLARLDVYSEEVRDRLGNETMGPLVLQELIQTLFERRGLRGNQEAYFDPRNFFLNDVLDRGLGLPLTLSIVLLEVGWRLGLPLEGVNFPNHFLVRYRGDSQNLLVDSFAGGDLFFEDQAQALLNRVYGGVVRMQPAYLSVASKRDIMKRLLLSLKNLYINAQDNPRTLAGMERMLLLHPDSPGELRDSGMLLARMGRVEESISRLRAYLQRVPEAVDAARVERMVRRLEDSDAAGQEEPHAPES